MRRGLRWRAATQSAALVLGLYAVVLLVSPALHHDLACHRTSPTHCTACTANPAASRAEPVRRLDFTPVGTAGPVETLTQDLADTASPLHISGRSPPA